MNANIFIKRRARNSQIIIQDPCKCRHLICWSQIINIPYNSKQRNGLSTRTPVGDGPLQDGNGNVLPHISPSITYIQQRVYLCVGHTVWAGLSTTQTVHLLTTFKCLVIQLLDNYFYQKVKLTIFIMTINSMVCIINAISKA